MEQNHNKGQKGKVRVFLIHFDDQSLGYDLEICDQEATVGDYMSALDDFAAAHLADCRGCDACCWERAPLTSIDIIPLSTLLPPSPYPAHAVVDAFATLFIGKDQVGDIYLRRGRDNACIFLDKKAKRCLHHQERPFVCHTHFCLPKTRRAQSLRSAVVNAGENELLRLLLEEEASGAKELIANRLIKEDYPPGPLLGISQYQDLPVRLIASPALWRELQAKKSSSVEGP